MKDEIPTICPKCGCQCYDPFTGKIPIHDIDKCCGNESINSEDSGIREGFHILPQLAENAARRNEHKIPWEEERYPTWRCMEKITEEKSEVQQALNAWTELPNSENEKALREEIEDLILSAYMLLSKVDDDLNRLRRGRKVK